MLDKEEVLKLEAELKTIQEKLHVHYIEELLHNCGVSPGEKVFYYTKTFQILDMDKLIRYNKVGGCISLYGRMIEKNGELSEVIYFLSSYDIRKIEE